MFEENKWKINKRSLLLALSHYCFEQHIVKYVSKPSATILIDFNLLLNRNPAYISPSKLSWVWLYPQVAQEPAVLTKSQSTLFSRNLFRP